MLNATDWPAIPYNEGRETLEALKLWSQVVGKVRLSQTRWLNHSWHVPLYVSVSGLSTGPIHHPAKHFQIDFDFINHCLLIQCSDGSERVFPLASMSVADFYHHVIDALRQLNLPVSINRRPNEVLDAVPFDEDVAVRPYDSSYARRLWQVLLSTESVFQTFRTGFIGKHSPVHFFWGSFDLASTRFSGRPAPSHPGGIPNLPDHITREAYSHEVSSIGFWPGGGGTNYPAYYSYAYPVPKGYGEANVSPQAAFFSQELGEFILPYDALRDADDPEETLLSFLQTTYEAGANLGKWDRSDLECGIGKIGTPRELE